MKQWGYKYELRFTGSKSASKKCANYEGWGVIKHLVHGAKPEVSCITLINAFLKKAEKNPFSLASPKIELYWTNKDNPNLNLSIVNISMRSGHQKSDEMNK